MIQVSFSHFDYCEPEYTEPPFHRKRPGLNLLAFQVDHKEDLDRFDKE